MPASRRSEEIRIKLDKDGGFVIPLAFCDALGIKAGDEIVMSWKDEKLCITKRSRRKDVPRERDRR
jgi:bifunctional DNA-binding transcriptional regulator/antitoxin component of YhaV-PrlF toxin-antitoxin module